MEGSRGKEGEDMQRDDGLFEVDVEGRGKEMKKRKVYRGKSRKEEE